jgi:hypothetical protein
MKEIFLGILFSIIAIGGISGQKTILPTESFTIEGAVEKPVTITLDSLLAQPVTSLDSVVITNHLGERKSVQKGLKAVSLLPFLEHIHIQAVSPKQLSEFYFVFEAVDGYKVVYSWNELFNSQKGREVYAIIGKEGKSLADLPDRIAIITPTDFMTGRRYVKSLSKIKVLSAD